MGKKDASANRGTPVEQYRKDIGITYIDTLFLICFCRDMSIIIVIEFVYKYPTRPIPGIRMLLVTSIAEILNVPVLFDMKSKSPTS